MTIKKKNTLKHIKKYFHISTSSKTERSPIVNKKRSLVVMVAVSLPPSKTDNTAAEVSGYRSNMWGCVQTDRRSVARIEQFL